VRIEVDGNSENAQDPDAMPPRFSLTNLLTPEGRLFNRWARSRTQRDPARRREGLRAVLDVLVADAIANQEWVLPFLEDFLGPDLNTTVTQEDLDALERLRDELAKDPATNRLSMEVDLAFLPVLERHGDDDDKIVALLFRLYDHPEATPEVRARCARSLIDRGEMSEDAMDLYSDFLLSTPDSAEARGVRERLAKLWQVDLEASLERIEEAERAALMFAEMAGTLPGVSTALGVAALRAHHDPEGAARHFAVASRVDPRDSVAILGHMTACVLSGKYDAAERLARSAGTTAGLLVVSLGKLAAVLRWLDGNGTELSPPARAQELAADQLRPWVGGCVDFAAARLRLIESPPSHAAEDFKRLTQRHPDDPRVAYYAAWSDLLNGSISDLRQHLDRHAHWAGAWTLLCRCWDAGPQSVPDNQVAAILSRAAPEFEALARCRQAIGRDEAPPATLACRPGSWVEEDIEALRIRMGYACCRADLKGLSAAMAQPLFRILPGADQRFWAGMEAWLGGNVGKARQWFREAAETLGHPRAAWALAVLDAQANDLPQAQHWTERALSGRSDPQSQTWRLWLNACAGNEGALANLDALAAQGIARAIYVRGQLGFQAADQARRSGRTEESRQGYAQSREWFATARSKALQMPEEPALLEACARFLMEPERGAPVLAAQWPKLEAIPLDHRRPWLLWLAVMAKIMHRDPRHAASVHRVLDDLLPKAGHLSDEVVEALAGGLAKAAADAPLPEVAEHWLALLHRLPRTAAQKSEREHDRMAQAASAWQRSGKASFDTAPDLAASLAHLLAADPGNVPLAVIAAFLQLLARNPAAAVEVLRSGRPETPGGTALLLSLAEAIEGKESADSLAEADSASLDPSSPSRRLLQAAKCFARGQVDNGYKEVIEAWKTAASQKQPQAVAAVLKVPRIVAVLCWRTKGTPPAGLLETVRELAAATEEPAVLDLLARSAAALARSELAQELWERIAAQPGSGSGPALQDYGQYLCHLAATSLRKAVPPAQAQRRLEEVKGRLRRAADLLEQNYPRIEQESHA
jgi:hypothetical protein